MNRKTIAVWLAAVLTFVIGDTETTFLVRQKTNAREQNPLMRPFVKRGRPYVYGVKVVVLVYAGIRTGWDYTAGANYASMGAGFTVNNSLQLLFYRWRDPWVRLNDALRGPEEGDSP